MLDAGVVDQHVDVPECPRRLLDRPVTAAALARSAPLHATRMPKVDAMSWRSFSISAASPKPLSMAASLRAMPRPTPLVEPVTTATLPFNMALLCLMRRVRTHRRA
jgi:hypothetical protein